MSFRIGPFFRRPRAALAGGLLAFAGVAGGGAEAWAKPDKAAAVPVPAAAGTASGRETVQRESRIEFDERMVQGQTAAGAIYLFQRGESEFRSMVKLPESFRERTIQPILPPSTKR